LNPKIVSKRIISTHAPQTGLYARAL